jgi:hypothetical protein
MSYEILGYALVEHINNAGKIKVPPSASINSCSDVVNAPQRPSADQLPDLWLRDTESLLSELGQLRSLALQIPPGRNDILGPIKGVIDALGPKRTASVLFSSAPRGSNAIL